MKQLALSLLDEEKRLLWRLRKDGPQPRSDLAQALQVSNAAITKLSRSLMTLGLIEEVAPTAAQGRGRPTVPLRISPAGGYAVGVTVHTGVLQIALVDHSGGIISLTNEKIDPPDPYHLARLVDQRIHELAVEHRLLTTRFLGVGLSVPGPTLSRNGNRWHIVPDLPGWRNVPLREIMDQTLGMPVWIENDATAAALAEYYLGGLMARCSTAIVILLGYGIGAGIIDDGRLFKGEIGNAGEVGRLFPSDRPRPSTVDLLSTLRSAGCDVASIVDFEQKTRGYEEVIEQWTIRAAQQLRGAIKSASAWFDPGVIRLSSPLPAWLIRRLSEILNDRPVDTKKSGVEFDFDAVEYSTDVSDLGGASSTLGAALLPIHALIGRYS